MPVFALDKHLYFPNPEWAEPEGLLAAGGDLSPERLLLAYRNGIFPWYQEEPILWWCPDPRFVLFPGEIRISRSMQQLLKRDYFEFTIDRDFKQVIESCKTIGRPGQEGTWITGDVQQAYTRLHQMGFAQSAEVWKDGQLAGGLYGVRLGKIFFGESMFSLMSNASKYAFIRYVQQLQKEGVVMIDCQVYTGHLESLGARMIPRSEFLQILRLNSGDQNLVPR